MNDLLDCGHAPSPHSPHTTGYGTRTDGTTACYECCAEVDKASMREHGKITLYFADGKWPHSPQISNWPGSLSFIAFNITRSHGGGFAGRYPIVSGRFRFEGALWTFRNAGDNQIARCRKLKDPRA